MEKSCSVLEILKFWYSANFESCDLVMSISTQSRGHLQQYILNHKLFGHKTWVRDL